MKQKPFYIYDERMLKHKDHNEGTDKQTYKCPEIPTRILNIHNHLEKEG
jgi:hypothetical protein